MLQLWNPTLVYLVFLIQTVFYPTKSAEYVPKSKRCFITRFLLELFCSILKSWLKSIWNWLDSRAMAVKKVKKRKLGCKSKKKSINIIRMACILSCAQSNFCDANSTPSMNSSMIPFEKSVHSFQDQISDDEWMSAECMNSTCYNADSNCSQRPIIFDTDSTSLKIDNCASYSISPFIEDFIGVPIPVHDKMRSVFGKNEKVQIMKGTVHWKIEDDDGKQHEILLPNTYYIPAATSRLLSPQHWAQVEKDHRPKRRGTWCATNDDEIVLYWNQCQYKRSCKLDPRSTNVATISTASGYSRFQAFCSEHEHDDTNFYACEATANEQEIHWPNDMVWQ